MRRKRGGSSETGTIIREIKTRPIGKDVRLHPGEADWKGRDEDVWAGGDQIGGGVMCLSGKKSRAAELKCLRVKLDKGPISQQLDRGDLQ